MADVQIAVIDPEDTQLALAAPAEAVVNVAVPGIQGPVGTTGSVTIAQAGTAATPGIRFESDTNTGIYSPGADQLAVSTGGTGRLFVDSSGNVGIGTVSPAGTLDVRTVGSAFQAYIGTNSGTSANDAGIIFQNVPSATASSRSSILYFDANGANATGGDYFYIGNTGDNVASIWNQGGGPIVFGRVSTESLRIDSSGRVGIGVSSPGAKLDLAAGTGASVTAVLIRSAAANANGFQIVTDSTTDNVYLNNFYNAALRFGTNNTERLRIDSSGNVGIGTSSPTTLLDVNADTVRVRTARTPASASATGAIGEICWDASYIYVCTATNTWRRSAISSW